MSLGVGDHVDGEERVLDAEDNPPIGRRLATVTVS